MVRTSGNAGTVLNKHKTSMNVNYYYVSSIWASLVAQKVKSLLQCRRPGFNTCVRKIPWRRQWLPTPIFLPEFHGQKSLAGYSSWSYKSRT